MCYMTSKERNRIKMHHKVAGETTGNNSSGGNMVRCRSAVQQAVAMVETTKTEEQINAMGYSELVEYLGHVMGGVVTLHAMLGEGGKGFVYSRELYRLSEEATRILAEMDEIENVLSGIME